MERNWGNKDQGLPFLSFLKAAQNWQLTAKNKITLQD